MILLGEEFRPTVGASFLGKSHEGFALPQPKAGAKPPVDIYPRPAAAGPGQRLGDSGFFP